MKEVVKDMRGSNFSMGNVAASSQTIHLMDYQKPAVLENSKQKQMD
jgi:hypothetical protein